MKNILIVAPHPDDEVLGAGGYIRKASAAGDRVTVLTVSGHLPPLYKQEDYETTVQEAKEAHAILGVEESIYLEIPATMVQDVSVRELNGKIHEIVSRVEPAVVLIPYPDRHVDHQVVFNSVQVATRPIGPGKCIELVAAYETLSETHWNAPHIEPNFTPNWVVDISNEIDAKIDALGCFASQVPAFPHPRSLEAARALALFRGTQAGFSYGEGFHIIRMSG
ncbi:MAG: PIG-L deacetylase family protein [Pseudomonadota bacterium]